MTAEEKQEQGKAKAFEWYQKITKSEDNSAPVIEEEKLKIKKKTISETGQIAIKFSKNILKPPINETVTTDARLLQEEDAAEANAE